MRRMSTTIDGNAIVYCEGHFGSTNGKTAHGLVRFTRRYRVLAVLDSTLAGCDAGQCLDGKPKSIPIVASLEEALRHGEQAGTPATHLVLGLAPDGGRLPAAARKDVMEALRTGLHVDSGLHDYLGDDPELAALAAQRKLRIRDVRKPSPRDRLHFFSGKINEVTAVKIAVLGTDSAVGKRTTAWLLVDALARAGRPAELVGTGQTAWMQGARYSLVIDSLINDFVSGEIEHAVWSAWSEQRPDFIIIEGQGSLMNPAYPGGHEILAAGRPDAIVLQHAPARREYDGFPGYPLHPLETQIQALELISDKPVLAVTVNHEHLDAEHTASAIHDITSRTGLPTCAPLRGGVEPAVEAILQRFPRS